ILSEQKTYPLRKYLYHTATVPTAKLNTNALFLFNNQQSNYRGKLRSVITYPPFETKLTDGTGFKIHPAGTLQLQFQWHFALGIQAEQSRRTYRYQY
ncbi:MAG: hypothetical protein V4616_00610, partial [Bacteroidota bacterium]